MSDTDWMDTTRAQQALSFEHHSWPDMLAEMRAGAGWRRYPMQLVAPLGRFVLKRRAAYRNAPGRYADPWGAIRTRMGDPRLTSETASRSHEKTRRHGRHADLQRDAEPAHAHVEGGGDRGRRIPRLRFRGFPRPSAPPGFTCWNPCATSWSTSRGGCITRCGAEAVRSTWITTCAGCGCPHRVAGASWTRSSGRWPPRRWIAAARCESFISSRG